MRQVTQAEYDTSKAAAAAYREFCKLYVQKNGWTVIPANVTRPIDTDAINAHSTNVELFELQRDQPAKFGGYVLDSTGVTSWTGEQIGKVLHRGHWHRNNFGGRWRSIDVRADWGGNYHGREYDSRQFVNLQRKKG